jgi:uncharacterized delta-60 repeat protein
MARLVGNSESGVTFLFWGDTEFRGFEKSGAVDLILRRSGNTNEPLKVNLIAEEVTASLTDVEEFPATVQFPAGASEARILMRLKNDAVLEGREVFRFLMQESDTNILQTRRATRIVILDDETPGTLDPLPLYEKGAVLHNFAVQADGKILLVTGPTTLSRLNQDGSLDQTFVTNGLPALPGDSTITDLQPQPNGKIYVGGRFNTTEGYGINHLGRLNSDGTLDTNFNPKLSSVGSGVPMTRAVVFDVLPDGHLIVWPGGISATSPIQKQDAFGQSIYRVDSTGAASPGFGGSRSWCDTGELAHTQSGDVFVYNDISMSVTRLLTNGAPDPAFTAQVPTSRGFVYDLEVIGEYLWMGGSFKSVKGMSFSNLVRLNLTNAAVDTNFLATVDDEVVSIREHNGKVFIAGAFTKVNGQDRFRVARLNQDGSLDQSFEPGLGPNTRPGKIDVENAGTLLMGINFDRVDRVSTTPLVRLEAESEPPEPPRVEVRREGADIFISYTSGRLEASVDLVSWDAAHSGGGDVRIEPQLQYQFFRAVQQ